MQQGQEAGGESFTLQTQDRPKAKDENKEQRDQQQETPNPECVIYTEKEKTRGYGGMSKGICTKSVFGKIKNILKKKLLMWLQNV